MSGADQYEKLHRARCVVTVVAERLARTGDTPGGDTLGLAAGLIEEVIDALDLSECDR